MDEKKQPTADRGSLLKSCRFAIAMNGLLASTFLYLLRINFSIGIVCMTYDPIENGTSPNVTSSQSSSSSGVASLFEAWMRTSWGDGGLGGYDDEVTCDDGDFDDSNETGEFDWSRTLRGTLNSSFFWGYVLTQFLGGWLATKYGGKRIVFCSLTMSAICCLLSPTMARISPYALMGIRFVNGLFQGAYYPASFTLNGKWFPLGERAILVSVSLAGTAFGSILSMAFSGFICAGMGWPWVFWMYGIWAILWLMTWLVFVHESPSEHPRISEGELTYIIEDLRNNAKQMPPVPWKALLTSPKVWVLVLSDFCNGWAWYMSVLTYPQYMEDVLEVDIRTNGVLNAIPLAVGFPMNFVFAAAADYVIRNKIFGVTKTRKIFHTITCLPPMTFAIGLGFITCEQMGLAVFLMTGSAFFAACNGAGEGVTRADIAPRFAGLVMGLCNTASNVAGIVAPIVIAFMTLDGTRRQWQFVFILACVLGLVNWTCFLLFASAEEQPWAKVDGDMDLPQVEVKSDKASQEKTLYVPAVEHKSKDSDKDTSHTYL